MPRFGNGAQLARELGVTRQAVSKREKQGALTRAANGKFDLDAAAIQYRLHTDPEQQRRALAQNIRPRMPAPAVGTAGDDSDWTGRRLRAEARLAELQLQEREGSLVARAEVERGAKRIAFTLVALLTPIADRIAAEFGVDEAHRRRLRQRIAEEIDQVRAEVARAGLLAEQ